jgi:hypothetical protein
MKICSENPNFVEIGQKYQALYMKTKVCVYITIEAPSSSRVASGC